MSNDEFGNFKPIQCELNPDRFDRFKKDIETMYNKKFNSQDFYKETYIILGTYAEPIQITSKGAKVLDSIGMKMYRGLKLSQKELEMMIYLGTVKINVEAKYYASNIIETLTKELKDKFDITLTDWDKACLSGDYYKKGYVESNPNHIPESRKTMLELLEKHLKFQNE